MSACRCCGALGAHKRCSRCGAHYCGAACQQKDWPTHKTGCRHVWMPVDRAAVREATSGLPRQQAVNAVVEAQSRRELANMKKAVDEDHARVLPFRDVVRVVDGRLDGKPISKINRLVLSKIHVSPLTEEVWDASVSIVFQECTKRMMQDFTDRMQWFSDECEKFVKGD